MFADYNSPYLKLTEIFHVFQLVSRSKKPQNTLASNRLNIKVYISVSDKKGGGGASMAVSMARMVGCIDEFSSQALGQAREKSQKKYLEAHGPKRQIADD